jgi:glutamate racemase
MPEVQPKPMSPEHCMTKLRHMQEIIALTQVLRPEKLNHYYDYGADVRYYVLYDSSDGALIAMKDFLGYLRARSNMEYFVSVVCDHDKSPYGGQGDKLFNIVINGMHYSVKLRPDGIVMLCNTACSRNLQVIRKVVEDIVGHGVDIIDLIKTTAEALVKYGGERPVVLCTQATKENGAYEYAITEAAKRHNVPVPRFTVIGCGDSNDPSLKDLDWASMVNNKWHLSDEPSNKLTLRREVNRYSVLIPADATSITLGCTHFAVLRAIIEECVQEHFQSAGRDEPIPIIDPVKYQADETAKHVRRHAAKKHLKHLRPGIEVFSTHKDIGKVKESAVLYSKGMKIHIHEADDHGSVFDGEDLLDMRIGGGKGGAGKNTPANGSGISVVRVDFEEIDLSKYAAKHGVDMAGKLLPKPEPKGEAPG